MAQMSWPALRNPDTPLPAPVDCVERHAAEGAYPRQGPVTGTPTAVENFPSTNVGVHSNECANHNCVCGAVQG